MQKKAFSSLHIIGLCYAIAIAPPQPKTKLRHGHFVVFSRNQHRRLLPAMCHNLGDGGPGPPATVFTTPSLSQR